MRTDTVGSLRQRMIEDMNARKLGSHTQRSHISVKSLPTPPPFRLQG
jgi:hypothetical protein